MPLGPPRLPALCCAAASSSPHINVAFTKALPVTKLLEMYEVGGWEDFLPFKRVWESHWCVPAADSWCYSVSAAEMGGKRSGFCGNIPSCIFEQFSQFMSLFSRDGLAQKNAPGHFFFFLLQTSPPQSAHTFNGLLPQSELPTRSSPGAPDGRPDTSWREHTEGAILQSNTFEFFRFFSLKVRVL